jgi:hypothetical protein
MKRTGTVPGYHSISAMAAAESNGPKRDSLLLRREQRDLRVRCCTRAPRLR